MIKITQIGDNIVFQGHTLPDICAATSSIMYTTVNAMKKYEDMRNRGDMFSYKDNLDADYVEIKIIEHDVFIDLLIENMFDMLNDLKDDNNEDKLDIVRK